MFIFIDDSIALEATQAKRFLLMTVRPSITEQPLR
jgi:hypothetical protein